MLFHRLFSNQSRKSQSIEMIEQPFLSLTHTQQRHLLNTSFPRLKGAFSPLSALKTSCIVLLVIFGGVQLYGAVYLKAKAQVAQILLERAWSNTQKSESLTSSDIHKPWSWADTYPVAKLSVPTQNIQQIVLAGATGRTLAFAPGLLMASYDFEEAGATAIAGHRDTHFSFLQHVEVGEIIEVETTSGKLLSYRILETKITNINDSHLRLKDSRSLLALITCYPFNTLAPTGDLRFIVTAELI